MHKIFVAVVILFICDIQLLAQDKNNIAGNMADSASKQPVEYATISLIDIKTNKVINGATTDSLGYFKLTGVDSGTYNLSIESIGYTAKSITGFHVKQSHVLQSAGNILLKKSTNTLQDVVVTSGTKLIENRIDKIVFNAENDVTSQGGVATDVLKKVPQISIDADGNVELAGSTGIRFLIDGKPSTAFGSNIGDVLQSIPASEIKSIEVITNPGAKYDAQGLGGVINIILKKSRVNGINGNVSLTGGTRNENGSFNITVRRNNFSLNAFVSGNTRLNATTPNVSDRTSTDSSTNELVLFHQGSKPDTKRYGAQGGVGFDWTISKYNNLSGNVNYNRFGNSGNGIVHQLLQTINLNDDSSVTSKTISTNTFANKFLFQSVDVSLNYKRAFKKENQSLEINFNSSFGKDNFNNNSFQTLKPQDSVFYGVNNINDGKENETELEINYTQPFTEKITLDAGADFTFDDIKSNAVVSSLNPGNKQYFYNEATSNYLSYKQQVYAAYAEMSFPVGKLFDAKTGLRYERTEINAYYSSAEQQQDIPGYNTLVPSAYLLKKITDNQTIKLSYSRRINRPDFDELNPFINTTDPKNITAGNPYLKPEKGNRVEFSYNHDYASKGSFMITVFYRQSDDDIQQYISFYPSFTIGDTVYTNVSVSTRENVGTEKNTGVSFFGTVKASDKFNLRTNIFFFRRHILNGIDNGRSPVSYNYRFNLNLSYSFSKDFTAELFGNFNSPRNELQGKYPSFTTYTIAARKQFWNKKASIALTANNLFNNYVRQRTELFGTDFTTNSVRQVPFRSIGLNFTYKFGKLDFKREKEDKQNDNDTQDNDSTPNQ